MQMESELRVPSRHSIEQQREPDNRPLLKPEPELDPKTIEPENYYETVWLKFLCKAK